MSSLSVCQGLQSCLEPRVIEPRVIRLKLAPPGSKIAPPPSESESHQQEQPDEKKDMAAGSGDWSFLQALSHHPSSQCNDHNNDDKVYVHPTVKRSSSMLSAKSLEMCTESLGSETGSDQNSLFISETHETHQSSNTTLIKHRKRSPHGARSFPPPLTSITHLMPHRHDGRLVLKAVAVASPPPESGAYFHAERSHGRLRLGFCLPEESESEEEKDKDDEDEEEDEEEFVENSVEEGVVRKFGRGVSSNGGRCKEGGNPHFFCADSFFDLIRTSIV
ncbi:protein FANTASTIC FOUR 2 [Arachis duranensis]|uniref:Protein FANTASTIC FOUR 2 n=1 Tax=Arachis duranensis TaxID=130453 RepID=A0A6P4DJZ0_ARADU|nr:protein FANTASTIC FOUR 2 [Arachis duranensis]